MATSDTSHLAAVDDHAEHGLAHVMPVRVLVSIFLILVLLTVVTIAATFFPTGNFEIWISLGIATVKASLVAAYFMHLISEKKLIYATLILTAIFFVALMFLPLSHYFDPITFAK